MKTRTKISSIVIAAPCFLIGAIVANHGSTFEIWMGRGIQIASMIIFVGILIDVAFQKKTGKFD